MGTWVNEYGTTSITHCKNYKCNVHIRTEGERFTCGLDGLLTVLSDTNAFFEVHDKDNRDKLFPINITLSNQSITITEPEESHASARKYCGFSGYYDGEYLNSNAAKKYAPGFNCSYAKTKTEKAICDSAGLAYADNVLSKLYAQLQKVKIKNIAVEQAQWLKERERCARAPNLNRCILDTYSSRIITLERYLTNSPPQHGANTPPYLYAYYVYLMKNSETALNDIFLDPPLQNYLNTIYPKEAVKENLSACFKKIELTYQDDSLLMLKGDNPDLNLDKICKSALVLTKNNETWIAYIDLNEDAVRQFVIFYPRNTKKEALPAPLKKWVINLIPDMENKEILYKKLIQ
jgi:hypothetical protein